MLDAVVIAAIHSHCIGGGLQVALACDLRVARDDAQFGITAVREGIIPGIGMWRVARHAGLGRAKRLALAAEIVDAAVAMEWGLVDWVVDGDAFEAKVAELTERMLTMGSTSTRLTKKLTNMAFDAVLRRIRRDLLRVSAALRRCRPSTCRRWPNIALNVRREDVMPHELTLPTMVGSVDPFAIGVLRTGCARRPGPGSTTASSRC